MAYRLAFVIENVYLCIMEIRYYTKGELAHAVLPHISQASAVNRLMIWINRCTPLVEQLHQLGYNKNQKYFTPAQVRAIAEALVL